MKNAKWFGLLMLVLVGSVQAQTKQDWLDRVTVAKDAAELARDIYTDEETQYKSIRQQNQQLIDDIYAMLAILDVTSAVDTSIVSAQLGALARSHRRLHLSYLQNVAIYGVEASAAYEEAMILYEPLMVTTATDISESAEDCEDLFLEAMNLWKAGGITATISMMNLRFAAEDIRVQLQQLACDPIFFGN